MSIMTILVVSLTTDVFLTSTCSLEKNMTILLVGST